MTPTAINLSVTRSLPNGQQFTVQCTVNNPTAQTIEESTNWLSQQLSLVQAGKSYQAIYNFQPAPAYA